MVDIQYANAYTEVLEILKNISQEDYNKVSKEKINLFEHNANKEYIFNYDSTKTLEEQNVSKTARAIIAILFRDYWATDEQRNKIKACAVFRAFPKSVHALVFIGYFSSPKCSSAFQMPSLSTSVVM